ncbi:MAG: response regulator transcription factor [Kiritimatiellae bacterium]|nr:response regulator transcription factor [Kiritimatiellia bacterium]
MKETMGTSILIIEDHERMRRAIFDHLHMSFPDCEILVAATGEEGLALAQTHSPQVVVTDLCLPGLNDFEVTRRIKALCPVTGIVMCSASDEPDDRYVAQEAGVDEWVSKAEAIDDLVPAIQRHLAGGVSPSQDRHENGESEPILASLVGLSSEHAEW